MDFLWLCLFERPHMILLHILYSLFQHCGFTFLTFLFYYNKILNSVVLTFCVHFSFNIFMHYNVWNLLFQNFEFTTLDVSYFIEN